MPLGKTTVNGLPWFDDGSGHRRVLGLLPHPAPAALRMAAPRFQDHVPVLPRDQWVPVSRRQFFDPTWILDQDGIGSCVANASAAALRKARWLSGGTDVPLSPGYLYGLINGGRDQGAVITAALDALRTMGTCSFQLVGQQPCYRPQMPAAADGEAKRFRVAGWWFCDTFDEIATAVQLGPPYVPVFGVMVGNGFERYDPSGVAGHDRGPGNHALHADGMLRLPDGRWVLDVPNSWRALWGPWGNGRVYLDEDHFGTYGDQPAGYVLKAAADDPQDPLKPPQAQ